MRSQTLLTPFSSQLICMQAMDKQWSEGHCIDMRAFAWGQDKNETSAASFPIRGNHTHRGVRDVKIERGCTIME